MKPKTLFNSDASEVRGNVPDVRQFGDGDMFKLLCKTSSGAEGWMKSTKAMEIPGVGCVVQVTTQQRSPDGNYVVAEALTFVPNVIICTVADEGGGIISRHLSLEYVTTEDVRVTLSEEDQN